MKINESNDQINEKYIKINYKFLIQFMPIHILFFILHEEPNLVKIT